MVCLEALFENGSASKRTRFATQLSHNVLPSINEFVKVDASVNSHAMEHVNDVFGGDVASSALGIGTSAEASNAGVNGGDAKLERSSDVGDGLAVGVVEVDSELVEGEIGLLHGF